MKRYHVDFIKFESYQLSAQPPDIPISGVTPQGIGSWGFSFMLKTTPLMNELNYLESFARNQISTPMRSGIDPLY